uniref:MATH domain-containing protein n=1 Tax=Caenorhabditis tropicalis TaxID=1561998 RepID=A0A1I7V0F8_9PELO
MQKLEFSSVIYSDIFLMNSFLLLLMENMKFRDVLNETNPTWEMFEEVNLGEKKEYNKDRIRGYLMVNCFYPEQNHEDESSRMGMVCIFLVF